MQNLTHYYICVLDRIYNYLMYIGTNYDTCLGAYNKYLIYKLDANAHHTDISIGVITGLYIFDDYFSGALMISDVYKYNGSVYHIKTRGGADHIVINVYGDILEIVSNMDKYKTMDMIINIQKLFIHTG